MVNENPVDAIPEANEVVEADSKRPYKTYAAIVMAMLVSVGSSETHLPTWLKVVIAALIAGLGVYLTPNPLKWQKGARAALRNPDTLW